jgi:hypothetical protein
VKKILNLDREDVLAARNDDILFPVYEPDEAILVLCVPCRL